MRVVIYTFNRYLDLANARRDELRAQGHKVTVLNARYYEGEVLPCDLCVCDWHAHKPEAKYKAAGIRTEVMRANPVVAAPDNVPAPRRSDDAALQPTQAGRPVSKRRKRSR